MNRINMCILHVVFCMYMKVYGQRLLPGPLGSVGGQCSSQLAAFLKRGKSLGATHAQTSFFMPPLCIYKQAWNNEGTNKTNDFSIFHGVTSIFEGQCHRGPVSLLCGGGSRIVAAHHTKNGAIKRASI